MERSEGPGRISSEASRHQMIHLCTPQPSDSETFILTTTSIWASFIINWTVSVIHGVEMNNGDKYMNARLFIGPALPLKSNHWGQQCKFHSGHVINFKHVIS